MGLIENILVINSCEKQPQLESIVPSQAEQLIINNQLPQFNTKTIVLAKNEVCHFIDKALLIVEKVERKNKKQYIGGSYKLTKNIRIYSGQSNNVPVESIKTEYEDGIIYITNKRIIFSSKKNVFEKKINNLTSIMPYSNAVGLQFGNHVYNLILPKPYLMVQVLHILQ